MRQQNLGCGGGQALKHLKAGCLYDLCFKGRFTKTTLARVRGLILIRILVSFFGGSVSLLVLSMSVLSYWVVWVYYVFFFLFFFAIFFLLHLSSIVFVLAEGKVAMGNNMVVMEI